MPVTRDAPAPYAPASAIIDLLKRYRNKGLPAPVTAEVLTRAGISQSLIPRTLQTLRTLDLVDASGAPGAILEGIRVAPEAEYRQRVADWLRAAYADALQFVDPATASDGEIRDAFRNYNPIAQQDRMVALFTGLFREAGIGAERQRVAARKTNGSGTSAKLATIRTTTKQMPAPAARPTTHMANEGDGKLPTPLAGLLATLPMTGDGWPPSQRKKFLAAFEMVLDYCIPIADEATKTTNVETAAPDEDAAESLNL